MNWVAEASLALVLLTDFALLGVGRLHTCIRFVALQGVLAGLFTLAMAVGQASLSAGLLVVGGTAAVLKGVVFPALLRKALRDAGVRKEIEPFVGYGPSLLLGVAMLPLSLWLSAKIFAPGDPMFFAAATSLTTMAVGLFLIVARRKALTQTIGYLAFENGIYLFGVAAVGHVPLLVEMGVLLDAFVAVFVMGIAIHHISREFDHIDADQLNSLKG